MTQQTAVDYLVEQLTNEGIYIPFGFYEQAKQMEKEQIEISDEEIWKSSIDYDNGAMLETPIVHFQQGAFWYREQLKKK